MGLSYQFLKKPLEGATNLSEFNTNLVKLAKKDADTYTQTVGDAYEVLAKAYFILEYPERFKNVWYYKEVPADIRKRLNLPSDDKGIDLILEDMDGRFTAVQCKFRSRNETILFWGGKDHLAHLIGSGTKCDSYAVFSNAYEIDSDVLSKMKEKAHSFDVLNGTLSELGISFWDNVRNLVNSTKPKEIADYVPYPDQKKAIDEVIAAFNSGKARARMIRFCGTGKSKIAKWIKDAMKLNGLTVLLVPSLSLAKQAKKDWNGNILYVCSDPSVERKQDKNDEDTIEADILSLGPNVTTDIKEIREYVKKLPQGVIICTYQSSHLLKGALKGIKVSLTIFDEAHRTSTKEDSHYATLLQDRDGFVSDFRLFMTATQRIVSAQVKGRQAENEDLPYLFSMDDESVYGVEAHNYNLRQAIDDKRVTPYLPVVTGITDEMIKENIVMRRLVKGLKPRSYDMFANVFACLQAIELKKVKHLIVYHKSIKASQEFIEIMRQVRPDIYSEHIDGTMSAEYRNLKFQDYANAPIGILSNSRCLTEGIDIASVDCVVFCDSKSSKIDIIQAMGRAMRIDYKGKVAYIIVPIYVTEKKVTEFDIANSNYATLIYLIKALSEIDFKMQDFITNICVQRGRKSKPKGPSNSDNQGIEVLAGVVDFMGDEFVKNFFLTEITDKAKNHWMYFYTLLVEYWREHGDCNVPRSQGSLGSLGSWVSWQRWLKSIEKLNNGYVEKLDKLGFVWDKREDSWDTDYNKLKKYHDKNGDTKITRSYKDKKLATWVQTQRTNKNKLSKERIKKLNDLGFVWGDFEDINWKQKYNELIKYKKENGDCLVPTETILGSWVNTQRQDKKISKERKIKLNKIGFVWKVNQQRWGDKYNSMIEYKKKHGDCLVKRSYKDKALSCWVNIQRRDRNKLSKERIAKLNKIGFVWSVK